MKTTKEYWDLHHKNTIELFKKRPSWMKNYDNDFPSAIFIRGLIADYKPSNILEIGTAAGWAAYYMLDEAYKYDKNTQLTSIDFAESLYYDITKEIGAAFKEVEPEIYKNWNLITKSMAIDFAKDNDKLFDFVFIDASHTHPWATLDFIAVLPFLKDDSVVVFHDIFLNKIAAGKLPATRHPENTYKGFEICKGPNEIYKAFKNEMLISYDDIAPNCGAIIVKSDNKIKIFNKLLNVLQKNWEYKYIPKDMLNSILPKYEEFIADKFGIKSADKFKKIFTKQLKKFSIKNKIYLSINAIQNYFLEKQKVISLKKEAKNKRIVLWGASLYLEKLIKQHHLNSKDIIGIIDKNPEKIGKMLGIYNIYAPNDLKNLNPDKIVSTVVNYPQMGQFIKEELNKQNLDIEINANLFSR